VYALSFVSFILKELLVVMDSPLVVTGSLVIIAAGEAQ